MIYLSDVIELCHEDPLLEDVIKFVDRHYCCRDMHDWNVYQHYCKDIYNLYKIKVRERDNEGQVRFDGLEEH